MKIKKKITKEKQIYPSQTLSILQGKTIEERMLEDIGINILRNPSSKFFWIGFPVGFSHRKFSLPSSSTTGILLPLLLPPPRSSSSPP
jgi:hypothetical protein